MPLKLDIEQIKSLLVSADLVVSWRVLLEDETADRALCRIRCHLRIPAYRLEIRLIQTEDEIIYSHQLFTDQPIIRWDNAPHFLLLQSFPHHVHQPSGEIKESALTGNPMQDLPYILSQVTALFTKPST